MISTKDDETHMILLICGLPASGKSTLSRALTQAFQSDHWIVQHLEIDALYEHSFEDAPPSFSPSHWKAARQQALDQTKTHLARVCSGSQQRSVLILDDNFYYKSMRKPFLRLTREFPLLVVVVVHCQASLPLLLLRNAARPPSRRVPDEAMHRISQRFEPPVPSADARVVVLDYFSEAESSVFSPPLASAAAPSFSNQVELYHAITSSLTPASSSVSSPMDSSPIPNHPELPSRDDFHHRLDIQSRKLLHQTILSLSPSAKKQQAPRLVALRSAFLEAYASSTDLDLALQQLDLQFQSFLISSR